MIPYIHSVTIRKEFDQNEVDGHVLALFGYWFVYIEHDAWCGHDSCGIVGSEFIFTTGREALDFLNRLPESLRTG